MGTKSIGSRVRFWCGLLAAVLLVVTIVSGFGWDIRTSDLISSLTLGLLDRVTSAYVHGILVLPLVLLLLGHIVLGWKRSSKEKKG